jgi:hypothetical protein
VIRSHVVKAHPERDGDFRWRGDGVSRIEGLSDAVFGFAVTLLVLVWFAHYRFFRRYGLEDGRTIVRNVTLPFVVLFYIYPLKFLFQTFIGLLLGIVGWKLHVPWLAPIGRESLAADRPDQRPALMCVYAGGWCAMYALFALMHRHALARREELGLDELGVLITCYTVYEHVMMIGVALLSVVVVPTLAYVVRIPVAATGFMAGPLQTVLGRRLDRQARARSARAWPRPAAQNPAIAPA